MNYNLILLAGNLTKQPEVRYSANNTAYSQNSIAVNNYSKNKQSQVMFVNCTFFGRNAEILAEYCNKGSNIFIEGKLQLSTYQNQSGVKVPSVSVTVNRLQLSSNDNKAKQPAGEQQAYESRRVDVNEEINQIDNSFLKNATSQRHQYSVDEVNQDTTELNDQYVSADDSDDVFT